MGGFWQLLLLSLLMALGSFGSGMLPLSMALPSDKLKLLSTFGSGLLIGTALAVILPEGVATLYAASSALAVQPPPPMNPKSPIPQLAPRQTVSPPGLNGPALKDTHGMPLEQVLGLSLTFGFAFMFLVDFIASSSAPSSHTKIAVSELSENGGLMNDSRRKSASAASIGLIIHSAADGVALGAASMSGSSLFF